MEGMMIEQHQLTGMIAQGGMGAVYAASMCCSAAAMVSDQLAGLVRAEVWP